MAERRKISLNQGLSAIAQREAESKNNEREMSPEEYLDLQIDAHLAYLERYRNWKDAATGDNYGYQEGNATPKKSELDKTAEELISITIAKIEILAIARRELIHNK